MTNKTKKPKWFYCELYKVNFHCFLGWSESDFLEYAGKHYNYKSEISYADAKCLCLNNSDQVIWTRRKRPIPEITHEAVHASVNILDMRGVKYNYENDESLAYLVEYIVRKILEL